MKGRVLLGVAAIVLVVGACSSFGGPDDDTSADAGLDAPTPPPSEAGPDAPILSCAAAELTDAGEDANCGGSLPADLRGSSSDCGFCGHSCAPEGCAGGFCTPGAVFTEGVAPTGIAIASGELFWGTANGEVRAGTTAGAGPRVVGTADGGLGSVMGMSVDAANVYVLAQSGVFYAPRAASGQALTPIAYAANNLRAFAADDRALYWWSELGRSIVSWAKDGKSAPKELLTLSPGSTVEAIVSDGTALFFVERTDVDGGVERTLERLGSDGSVGVRLQGFAGVPLAVDATWIYWGEDGAIRRAKKDTAEPAELVASWSGTKIHPRGLAVTDTSLYWSALDDSNGGNDQFPALFTSPKCGGRVHMIEGAQENAHAFVLDDTHLYWSAFASIKRTGR